MSEKCSTPRRVRLNIRLRKPRLWNVSSISEDGAWGPNSCKVSWSHSPSTRRIGSANCQLQRPEAWTGCRHIGSVPASVGNEGRHDTFLTCPILSPRWVAFVRGSTDSIVTLHVLSLRGRECGRRKGAGITGSYSSNVKSGRGAFDSLRRSLLFDLKRYKVGKTKTEKQSNTQSLVLDV